MVGDRRRQTLTKPVSNLRASRRETGQTKATSADDVAKADAALTRFLSLLEKLPAEQAEPLREKVMAAFRPPEALPEYQSAQQSMLVGA
jgi:hypothetical protein